jgi:hypothetical protein
MAISADRAVLLAVRRQLRRAGTIYGIGEFSGATGSLGKMGANGRVKWSGERGVERERLVTEDLGARCGRRAAR